MKSVRPVIASNGVTYLQTKSIGLHSTSWKEKKGKDCKERKGPDVICQERERERVIYKEGEGEGAREIDRERERKSLPIPGDRLNPISSFNHSL